MESAGNLLKPARSSNDFLGWGHTSSSEIYRISSKVKGTSSLCSSWFFVKHLKKINMGFLLFLFMAIMAAIVGVLYLKYEADKKYQTAVESHLTTQNVIAGKAMRGVVEGIKDVVDAVNFRPSTATEAMVKRFAESGTPGVTGIKLPVNALFPVYAFVEAIQNSGITVFSEQRDDAIDDYRSNFLWLCLMNTQANQEDDAQSIVLRFSVNYFPIDRFVDSENLKKYAVADELPCVDSITLFVPGVCDRDCQIDLTTTVTRTIKQCTPVQFIPNPTEGNIWVHRINEEGRIIPQKMSYTGFDKAFFDAAYTELRTQGADVRNVFATKFVEGLVKTWTKTRANICIFGTAGTGKSTLLKAIAKLVSDTQDMKVLSISGRDFAKHFSNPSFTSNLRAYWQDEKVIVLIDEFHSLNSQENASIKSVLDGMDTMENVSFVLATNEESFNDEAITRNGRMEMLLSIIPFQKEEDAKNMYELLLKQNPDVKWRPFPEKYVPMTLADISGLKLPVSLWDAIQ